MLKHNEFKNKKVLSIPQRDLFTNAYIELDTVKRVITHYITSGEPNRYNQVVNISGYDDTDYRKNPIVLFNHGDNDMLGTLDAGDILEFVIGRNLWIRQENNMLKAKTEFANTELACEVFDLYNSKVMNAWSKHFYPISEPRLENGIVYYDKWGMYEYSACMLPVDPNAITTDVSYETVINSVRNKFLKNTLTKNFLRNKIETDDDTKKLIQDITELKSELIEMKNKLSGLKSNEDIESERNSAINKAIKNNFEVYNQVMSKKLLEIVGNVNNLAETVKDMPVLVTNCVAGAIRKAQGKLD